MKKKLLTKTYVRDVEKFNLKIFQLDDYIVCVKQIVKVHSPFITSGGVKLIDNNFQIVEILPKHENYAMRVFLDDKKQIIQRYFDITKQNAIDAEVNVPFYLDLYLDVIIEDDNIRVVDEKDLDNALKTEQITKDDYSVAIAAKDKLINELKAGNNALMAFNFNDYLF